MDLFELAVNLTTVGTEQATAALAGVGAAGEAGAAGAATLDAALSALGIKLVELDGAAAAARSALDSVATTAASSAAATAGMGETLDVVAAGMSGIAPYLDEVAYGMAAAGAAAATAGAETAAAGAGFLSAAEAAAVLGAAAEGVEAAFAPLLEELAPLLTVIALFEAAKHAVEDTADLEESQARLRLAVQNTGASWDASAGMMQGAIQRVVDTTTVGVTEATDALQRLVLFSGSAAVAAQNLALAVNIARAANVDLDTATRALGAALGGNETLLQRMFRLQQGTVNVLGVVRQRVSDYAATQREELGGSFQEAFKDVTEFLISIGSTIVSVTGLKSVVESVGATIRDATQWVNDNRASFELLADIVRSVVQPAWVIVRGAIAAALGILREMSPVLFIVGQAFNVTWNAIVLAIGAATTALGYFVQGLESAAHGLSPISETAAAVATDLDGVGGSLKQMGATLREDAHRNFEQITQDLANIAAQKERIDRPSPAPQRGNATQSGAGAGTQETTPVPISELLKNLDAEVQLGKALAGMTETHAEGVKVLNQAIADANAILERHDRQLTDTAKAYGELHDAREAVAKALPDPNDKLAKDLHDEVELGERAIKIDKERAAGIQLLVDAALRAQRLASDKNLTLDQRTSAAEDASEASNAVGPQLPTLSSGQIAPAQQVSAAVMAQNTAAIQAHSDAVKAAEELDRTWLDVMEQQIAVGESEVQSTNGRTRGITVLKDVIAQLSDALKSGTLSAEAFRKALEDIGRAEKAMGKGATPHGDYLKQATQMVNDVVVPLEGQLTLMLGVAAQKAGLVLVNGLDRAISAAAGGKNPLKALETTVLQGLGNIFSQMGQELIMASPIFVGLGAAAQDVFTAGPAMLLFGIALTALGAALGGIAQGGSAGSLGGAGGGDVGVVNRGTTTNMLVLSSAAGNAAAGLSPMPHIGPNTFIGPNDPAAQRALGQIITRASQRGIKLS